MLIYCILFLYKYKVDRVVAQVHGHCSIPRLRATDSAGGNMKRLFSALDRSGVMRKAFCPQLTPKICCFPQVERKYPGPIWANTFRMRFSPSESFDQYRFLRESEWLSALHPPHLDDPKECSRSLLSCFHGQHDFVFPGTEMLPPWSPEIAAQSFFDSAAWDQCAVFFWIGWVIHVMTLLQNPLNAGSKTPFVVPFRSRRSNF